MSAMKRLDAVVVGRVQGVGFRAWTAGRAYELGLVGWVVNRADGNVRCIAEGPEDRLLLLLRDLREGPPAAIVETVTELWGPATGSLSGFAIRSADHTGD